MLIDAWRLIEKYHLYEADALQIVSAKHMKSDALYTSDKKVYETAVKEGIKGIYLGPA